MLRPRRSVLYLPASNARMLDKARTLDCDGLILDLEDAVAPEDKATARRQMADAIAAGGFASRETIVRINALASPWGEDDLAAVATAGPDGVALPKVGCAADIVLAAERLEALGAPASLRIWALIESPAALLALPEIAVAPRLAGLIVGVNDLARQTGVRLRPGRALLLPWLMQVIAAARAHGLAALDGVFTDLRDAEGFAAECRAGRDMGFDGKTLIHPAQIAAANAAFRPSEAELGEARALVAAFADPENDGRAVLRHAGRMVERLHAEAAADLIALDDILRTRTNAG